MMTSHFSATSLGDDAADRALVHERLHSLGAQVEHGHIIATCHKMRRHAAAHVSQANVPYLSVGHHRLLVSSI